MNVLDELREQIRDLYPEYRDRPSFTDGLYAALNIIDAFEAAHPGLKDITEGGFWCCHWTKR